MGDTRDVETSPNPMSARWRAGALYIVSHLPDVGCNVVT